MKLSGKCKEDFLNKTMYNEQTFDIYNEIFQNSLIIEWFDYVEIYIGVYSGIDNLFDSEIMVKQDRTDCGQFFNNRQEATNKAIEKANELYNEK